MQGEASHQLSDKFTALLFGIAVGDALGLPAEGMSREKIRRRWHGEWKMRLLFGRGMISDDTEHALLAAKCLIKHPHDASAFQQALACELRWW
ncbi:MAG: ADP-ribosylglycohydrolase family protein, partial [Limisphaerales bacterium]